MKITQDAFASAVETHYIPVDVEPALAQAGVGARALGTIVGQDGVLDRAEADTLYQRLRRSPKGQAAAAHVMVAVARDRAEVEALRQPWRDPEPPRAPTDEARATYREDTARLARHLAALGERAVPSQHSPSIGALKGVALGVKAFELAEIGMPWLIRGLGLAAAGPVVTVLGPAIVAAEIVTEIGEANLEGPLKSEREQAIAAYADGVAAALDHSWPTHIPTDPTRRALYEQGLFETNALSPEERRDLEDRLVLVARVTSMNKSYSAPTYASAINTLARVRD